MTGIKKIIISIVVFVLLGMAFCYYNYHDFAKGVIEDSARTDSALKADGYTDSLPHLSNKAYMDLRLRLDSVKKRDSLKTQ